MSATWPLWRSASWFYRWHPGALAVGALLLAGVGTTPLAAQAGAQEIRVDTGVDPDTVTIGERFRSAMRVVLPVGYRVEFEEIAATDTVEAASPVQLAEQPDGGTTAVFEMVAWQTGDSLTVSVPVRVIGTDGEVTEHALPLAMPFVASVLPAEDEKVEPRPVKDLVVPPAPKRPFPWWWLLVAAAIAALLYAWWRSRGRSGAAEEDPRAWAIGEIDALLADEGAIEPVELYRRGSWILRSYLARVDKRLGTDLTTSEVVRRARAEKLGEPVVLQLALVLEDADRVKFSPGHPATRVGAQAALGAVREFVSRYPPQVGEEVRAARRAA